MDEEHEEEDRVRDLEGQVERLNWAVAGLRERMWELTDELHLRTKTPEAYWREHRNLRTWHLYFERAVISVSDACWTMHRILERFIGKRACYAEQRARMSLITS